MGLESGLDQIGLRTEEVAYFSAQGQLIWAEPRGSAAGYGWPQFSLNRGKLLMLLYDTLIERAGPEAVTTGTMVSGWEGSVTAHLSDRKTGAALGTAEGDLLIACDGIPRSGRRWSPARGLRIGVAR
ncbi:MAG: hypothetical protein AAFP28_11820 [Pseudomonadota bacterium]